MTALGIMGIIFSGVVAVLLLMSGIYALLEKYFSEKKQMALRIIDYAAVTYSAETRKLFQNIMKDSAEAVPNMVKGMYKAFDEDEEL